MSGINDYKITSTTDKKVGDLPGETLSGTVQENKDAFDQLGLYIIEHYNGLIDYIRTNVLPDITDLGQVYPVGSIYMSVNSVNPSTLFGGSWERIKDKFLLSAGDNYSAGDTGGSADATLVAHTHTVSGNTSQVSNHNHNVSGTTALGGSHRHGIQSGGYSASGAVTTTAFYRGSKALSDDIHYSEYHNGHTHTFNVTSGNAGAHSHTVTGTAESAGTSATGANMPPYLTVYVWKRIA